MEIIEKKNGGELIVALEGELNSQTAPMLDAYITKALKEVETLIFDFAKLDYLSSAGLRTLLVAQKVMARQGEMIIRHVNEDIRDVFALTGFDTVLTIED